MCVKQEVRLLFFLHLLIRRYRAVENRKRFLVCRDVLVIRSVAVLFCVILLKNLPIPVLAPLEIQSTNSRLWCNNVWSVHGEVSNDLRWRQQDTLITSAWSNSKYCKLYESRVAQSRPPCYQPIFFGESLTLGEKRSSVWFWGRRSRRRQRSKRFRLESIKEESSSRADTSWRMWDVVTMPGKLGDALGYVLRYAQQSIAVLLCPV